VQYPLTLPNPQYKNKPMRAFKDRSEFGSAKLSKILARLGVVFRSERLSRKGIFCLLFWAIKKVGPPEGGEGKQKQEGKLLFAQRTETPPCKGLKETPPFAKRNEIPPRKGLRENKTQERKTLFAQTNQKANPKKNPSTKTENLKLEK
ncbi:MAG: hypothetical protein RIE58_05890, partial [Vicingaceae bacterium]